MKITKPLFLDLCEKLSKFNEEIFIIYLHLNKNRYMKFMGALSTKRDSFYFDGIQNNNFKITFSDISEQPQIDILSKEDIILNSDLFINFNFVSILTNFSINNKWEPPEELIYSSNPNVNFPLINELDFERILKDINSKPTKNVELRINYFNEEYDIIRDMISGLNNEYPIIKSLIIKGKITKESRIISVKTENGSALIFYDRHLKAPLLNGLKQYGELTISDITYRFLD